MVVATASMVYMGAGVVVAAYETDEDFVDDDDDAEAEEAYEPDDPEVLEVPVQSVSRVSAESSQEREFSSSFQTV